MLLCTANVAFANNSAKVMLKTVISKYSMVLLALVVFSTILYVGLTLYNKFFVSAKIKDYKLKQDSLSTPTDKDDAILTFITKNRLK
ncbi:hypothetical protein IJ541_09805 [bacterium]|nr:hypothetical protein [bacterium]